SVEAGADSPHGQKGEKGGFAGHAGSPVRRWQMGMRRRENKVTGIMRRKLRRAGNCSPARRGRIATC
ncbi:MAG: hypothetical protein ACOVO5_02365, partial [Devosia sp.]